MAAWSGPWRRSCTGAAGFTRVRQRSAAVAARRPAPRRPGRRRARALRTGPRTGAAANFSEAEPNSTGRSTSRAARRPAPTRRPCTRASGTCSSSRAGTRSRWCTRGGAARGAGDRPRADPRQRRTASAGCYTHLGQCARRWPYCQRSLKFQHEIGHRAGEADTWDSLGYTHSRIGTTRRRPSATRRRWRPSAEMATGPPRPDRASTWATLGCTRGTPRPPATSCGAGTGHPGEHPAPGRRAGPRPADPLVFSHSVLPEDTQAGSPPRPPPGRLPLARLRPGRRRAAPARGACRGAPAAGAPRA